MGGRARLRARMSNEEKVISMPVKEIAHMKVILATWYAFLRDQENLTSEEFSQYLKTPVIYNLEQDAIEILFAGSDELLQAFKNHVLKK